MMDKIKNIARQISELDKPLSHDFDPEEEVCVSSEEAIESEESADELAGTEHYGLVGRSKLIRPEISLGIEYSGSKVSRQALETIDEDLPSDGALDEISIEEGSEIFAEPENYEPGSEEEDGDIDSDEALAESDDQKFQNFVFRGSSRPRVKSSTTNIGQTAEDSSSESDNEEEGGGVLIDQNDSATYENESSPDDCSEDNDSDSEGAEEWGSEDEENGKAERSELQKIMAEDQKVVLSTLTEAAKTDVAKGNAVKIQRKAFGSLLNVRMALQKALIATNSMAAVEDKDCSDVNEEPYVAAEEAATKLWNTLDGLRHELSKSVSTKTGQKRKRAIELSTPSSSIWERMKSYEVAFINHRQTTLEKWSANVRGISGLPVARKLGQAASQQSITSVIQDHLAKSEHLIRKTKVPRSCAPMQRDNKIVEDVKIYDDGNFYQMLLKELVDQRRMDSLNTPAIIGGVQTASWAVAKEAKTKKVVDTRASKGRKMKYTVHEKLQNFMAPENRNSWEPAAVDRLFGTLLGQKIVLSEDPKDCEEEESDFDVGESLRLFKS